jgi:DNA-binding NtrC family response regulator
MSGSRDMWNFSRQSGFLTMIYAPEASVRPAVVIVTEDEALLRAVAVALLNDEGFVTIEAEHAAAALKICELRAQETDVLFTDVRMPGAMNGLELARRVRERWPWILVIIVSGHLGLDELPEGARFLSKPYDMRRVADIISALPRRT